MFDGLVKNTLSSLNIIYSFRPDSVGAYNDGFWSLTGTTGQYTGSAQPYQFTIGEDVSVEDR